jgi:hypothetical protein
MSTTSGSEPGAPESEAGAPPEPEPVAASEPEPGAASESKLEAAPGATQTEDDWDEIKADVKQLVKALSSLAP